MPHPSSADAAFTRAKTSRIASNSEGKSGSLGNFLFDFPIFGPVLSAAAFPNRQGMKKISKDMLHCMFALRMNRVKSKQRD